VSETEPIRKRGQSPFFTVPFFAAIVAASMTLLVICGCDSAKNTGERRGPRSQTNVQGEVFQSVVGNLDRLEQFDFTQMLPLICDRLNQWNQQEKPSVAWKPEPLLSGLPQNLRDLTVVKRLDFMDYRLPDAWYLQESVWLRNISKNARADQFEDLAVAERLFDWTVRNIQLDPDAAPTDGLQHTPVETLLFGHGQALDRAWVFLLLARQQGLDVVLLGLADEKGGNARLWLPALLSKDELYLFDCRLGLPIPGPGGRGVATLAQVIADEQLLRALDVDEDHKYPITGEDLRHVVAFVEASPSSLSRRMALVESRLAGKSKMALTSPGSALAERVKKVPNITDVKLWPHPFEVWLAQSKRTEAELQAAGREMMIFRVVPSLMKGRSLYFKGVYDGEKGAKKYLLETRPPDAMIDNYRISGEDAKKFRPEDLPKIEAAQTVMMKRAKQDASLWLGMITYDQQDYASAIDYFGKRTLEAAPKGPWAAAARYNLARSYEASGEFDKAQKLLESDKSGQSHGNQLRARRLKEEAGKAEVK